MFKKVLIIITFVLIHITIIRQIRTGILNAHYNELLAREYGKFNRDLIINSHSPVSLTLGSKSNIILNEKLYKIPFGMFFLFSVIGLIIVGSERNDFYILIAIHSAAGIISFIGLSYSINGHNYFLLIPDLISRYIIPLLSLGLVAFSYLQKKNSIDES